MQPSTMVKSSGVGLACGIPTNPANGKFPVLRDDAWDRTVPELSIIVEYLAWNYRGRTPLVPADPDGLGRLGVGLFNVATRS